MVFNSWRIVLRRSLADPLLLTAAAVTILLAITLLTAGPVYTEAVTEASLHRILQDDSADASIEISTTTSPDSFDDLDNGVRQQVATSFNQTGATVFANVVGDSMQLDVASEPGIFPLASLQYFEDIENRATLIEGSWPTDDSVEVALLGGTATALGLTVSDTLVLTSRSDRNYVVEATVVGIFEANDPAEAFWIDDEELIRHGVVEANTLRTFGPMVVTRATALGPLTQRNAQLRWRVLPDHTALTVAGIPDQRSAVASLDDQLNTDAGSSDFTVVTGLGNLLEESERSVVATRSSVLMITVQLAILSAYALVHTAGLIVDSRVVETGLLRARGTGNRQILASSAMEGVMLTLPAVLMAPPLAALLLRLLSRFGPLAAIGLDFEPRVNSTSYTLALMAALFCIGALALPAYRSSRTFNDSLVSRARQETKSFAQRAGWDVALIALTVVAFWQLATHGVEISSNLGSGWGIDPLLVAVPALGMLGGAVLALRFVPFMAGILERVTRLGRGAVSALSAWQVSRRPRRYARAALLLIIAVAVGFFVSAYSSTWGQSQYDQAAFRSGAEVRVVPNRATGSIRDIHLRQQHEEIEGVEASMPVALAAGQPLRPGPLTRFFAFDAAIATDVLALREPQLGAGFRETMDLLVASRPTLDTIPLPGEPRTIQLQVEVVSEEPCGAPIDIADRLREEGHPEDYVEENRWVYSENCLAPIASVVVQDRNGMIHRVEAGEVAVNAGPVVVVASLVGESGGSTLTPAYPLSLLAVEFGAGIPGFDSDVQEATITFSVSADDGGSSLAPVVFGSGATVAEVAYALQPEQMNRWPFVALGEIGQTVTITVNTGSANRDLFGKAVDFGVRPSGSDVIEAVPFVLTDSFLQLTGLRVGDVIDIRRFETVSGLGQIVGTIERFPTVPEGPYEAAVFDLASLQAAAYQPGARLDVSEYWLSIGPSTSDDVAVELMRAPLNSLRLNLMDEQTQALVTDPLALSTIAALSLGFVGALVFAMVGLMVNTVVLARERRNEFSLLRALGLSGRQLRRWLAVEQSALVLAGIVLGTLVGFVLASVVLPLIAVTQAGVVPVPEPEVMFPVSALIGLNVAVVVVMGAMIAILTRTARRVNSAAQLRIGEG